MQLAAIKPPFCAACYQHSTEDHVDFGGTYDGPMMLDEVGNKIPIDDLIICRSCIRAAAKLVGMMDPKEDEKQVTELKAENAALNRERLEKNRVISNLEYTLEVLTEFPTRRAAGKPKLTGLDQPTKERLLTKQRRSRSNKKTAKEKAKA